jgi:hypothetical protein
MEGEVDQTWGSDRPLGEPLGWEVYPKTEGCYSPLVKRLDDFSRWYCRHTNRWRWREKRPSSDALRLGHVTEGEASSKGLATAAIRLELQRREAVQDQVSD